MLPSIQRSPLQSWSLNSATLSTVWHSAPLYTVVSPGTLRYTVLLLGTIWYPEVHWDTPWYTEIPMVPRYCGTQSYTEIPHDTLRYPMVPRYHGTQLGTVPPSWYHTPNPGAVPPIRILYPKSYEKLFTTNMTGTWLFTIVSSHKFELILNFLSETEQKYGSV